MFVNGFPFVSDNVFVFIYSHWLCQDWCFWTDWWFCVVPISSPPDSIHLSVDGVGVLCEASRTRLLSCWESPKVNPLLYPHSSHLTYNPSFLLLYPFIPFKSGNYVPRQFLNELSSTLIPQVWAASRLSLVIHCTTLNTTSARFTGISRLSLFFHLQHFIVIFL